MYYSFRESPMEDYGILDDPKSGPCGEFMMGNKISNPVPNPWVFPVNNSAKHPPADYLGVLVPVFSNRLVKRLQDIGVGNFQTFEVRLENPDTGETWTDYQAVAIMGLVECLDVEASGAIQMLPPLCEFDLFDLTINKSRIGGALLFRMVEAPEVILIEWSIGDQLMDTTPEFRGLEFRDVNSA